MTEEKWQKIDVTEAVNNHYCPYCGETFDELGGHVCHFELNKKLGGVFAVIPFNKINRGEINDIRDNSSEKGNMESP